MLLVPSFKFSLLSVPKLTPDAHCFVTFYAQLCVIKDLTTMKVVGQGKKRVGLYQLLNVPLDQIDTRLSSMMVSTPEDCSFFSLTTSSLNNKYAFSVFSNSFQMLHHRLGHISDTQLKHLPCTSVSTLSD